MYSITCRRERIGFGAEQREKEKKRETERDEERKEKVNRE